MALELPMATLLGAGLGAGGMLAGGAMSSHSARKVARMQMNQQQQFALNALSWRVADAKRAGVHPLYALGAQLPSFTPVSVDFGQMGEAVAQAAGQIGNAIPSYIEAKQALHDREMAQTRAATMDQMAMWQVTNQRLEADRKVAEIGLIDAQAADSRASVLRQVLQLNKERAALTGGDNQVVLGEVLKGAGGMQSGPADQSWKPFVIGVWPDGKPMYMDFPSGQQAGAQQAFESVEGVVPGGLTLAHNVAKYGPSWANSALEALQSGPQALGQRHRQIILNFIRKYWR